MNQDLVCLGIIVSAHGIKGDVAVKVFTANPVDLFSYGPLRTNDGRVFDGVLRRVVSATKIIAHFQGSGDRNHVETLIGTRLYIDRSCLPLPDDDEYYYDDLIGCAVVSAQDESLVKGVVTAVHDHGGGVFVDVDITPGKQATLAFNKEAVLRVDISSKKLVIDPVFLISG